MYNKTLTLGSLFSGSGAFELAAKRLGIKPLWASEVEPFPIAVTRKHFPDMLHLGDICKIDGSKIPPVDIITGGFCCQDLSVAGKQIGLHGERSGLFFQMIRIIREMLEATDGNSPRYLIFENVPGLLSSSKGADFREVMDCITDLGFIADPNILDSQDFKIAQRRKRVFIACINKKYYNPADFADCPKARDKRMEKALANWQRASVAGGETFHGITSRPHTAEKQRLSEILERDVDERYYLTVAACLGILRRVDAKCKEIPQLLRSALESQAGLFNCNGNGEDVLAFLPGSTARLDGNHSWENIAPTLRAETHSGDNQTAVAIPIDQRNSMRKGEDNCGIGIGADGDSAYTVTAEYTGAIAVENHMQDFRLKLTGDTVQTLCRNMESGQNVPLVLNRCEHDTQSSTQYNAPQAVCVVGNIIGRKLENGGNGMGANEEISYTLTDVDRHAVAYTETAPTLDTGLAHQNSNQIMLNGGAVVEEVYSMTTGSYCQTNAEKAPTLQARDFKSAPICNVNNPAFGLDRASYNQGANAQYKPQIDEESIHSITAQGPGAVAALSARHGSPNYVVRRLTPTECLVLMNLPRNWCDGLENENPTAEDIAFWTEVFETYRRINNPTGKPKTEKQIRRFLKKPYSDSACYKMAGNGAVTAVCEWVLRGISEHYYYK